MRYLIPTESNRRVQCYYSYLSNLHLSPSNKDALKWRSFSYLFVGLIARLHQNYQMDLDESKTKDRTITTYSLQGLLGIGSYRFQISDSMVKAHSEVTMESYRNKYALTIFAKLL